MKLDKSAIKLSDIDMGNEFFRYSDERYDAEALMESISYSGMLNPVILLESEDGYRVVAGFRRIKAVVKLGLNEVQAYIIKNKANDEELLKLSILENQSTRALNLYEKAVLLSKLKDTGISQKKIINIFMPIINLSPSLKHMEEIMTLREIPAQLVDYIISKDLSARKFRHLKYYSGSSLAFLVDFVDYLNPGANLFVEITRGLAEVSKRDDKELDDIIDSQEFPQLIKDITIEKGKKINEIREKVFDLRYPVLSKENRKIEQKLGIINTQSNQDIEWDRSLEKKGLQVRLMLNKQEDLKTSMILLKEMETNQVLKDLFS